ncbi:site-specific DNA-methyltransferase [Telluribacter sp. SYSU D00476]|uniref:site-specific DNA-methyltransferase n=1 Tax=Telluribacter sp. SYSU D00476 TaxID=2811430 RepID=UPI001FF20F28|nr:site-specific DNA-methyltransferase [Telluribacter sp. SYSU D00476]
MNKQELIEALKQQEGLTQDQKAYLINLVNTKKKYGLMWEDKPEDVEEFLRQHLPVLSEVVERRILASPQSNPLPTPRPLFTSITAKQGTISFTDATEEEAEEPGNPSEGEAPGTGEAKPAPDHILIEGDNLHALTALTFTHEGLVDVIYIDPPYNTGNKDFKYNDRFIDHEDTYRHSKWLSFMQKRLLIAKRLLSSMGVIFISIDDNEQAQLKLLCDEVFGEENFIDCIIWQKNFAPRSSAKFFSSNHEFILCYTKNKNSLKLNLLPRTSTQNDRYKNPDNDPRGIWTSGDLSARNYYSLGTYKIVTPGGRVIDGPPKGMYWRVSEENFKKLVEENKIWFGSDGKGVPRLKRFLSDVQDGVLPQTIWLHTEAGNTQEAKKEVLEVFGNDEGFFTTPKPLKLLNRILNIASNKNSIILDFFAGSGTTLHATMQLNAEDGGIRQCILVTNNENGIAEEVCYERNKRVIQGYTNAKGQQVPGLTNNSLRYYRSDMVPRQTSLPAKRLLMQRATELLCIKEGLYEEVPSLSLDEQIRGYGRIGRYLIIIYDDLCIDEAVLLIRQAVEAEPQARFKVYVFSNGQYPYTEEFEEVLPYVTLCALPDAIYKAYRQVLPDEQAPAQIVEEEAAETTPLTLF